MKIKTWIDHALKDIAHKLPQLAHEDPASFACGFNVGYKQCLLDLDLFLSNNLHVFPLKEMIHDEFIQAVKEGYSDEAMKFITESLQRLLKQIEHFKP